MSAQIVQQIFDQVSDGIAELTLLIVVLAKKNGPPPATLKNAVEVVLQPAGSIAEVSREMAADDYAAFPDIASEMTSASDLLTEGTKKMIGAINTLVQTSNRKDGWNGLMDACRIMSGQVLRVLQLVYGAEIKRLVVTIDSLSSALGDFDPDADLSKPENEDKLIANINEVRRTIPQFRQYMEQLAEQQENPYAARALREAVDDAENSLKRVMSVANTELDNPKNASDLANEIKALQKKIISATDQVKNAAPDREVKSLEEAIRDVVNNLRSFQRQPEDKYASKIAVESLQEAVSRLRPIAKYTNDADKVAKQKDDFANSIRNLDNSSGSSRPTATKNAVDLADRIANSLASIIGIPVPPLKVIQLPDDFGQLLDHSAKNLKIVEKDVVPSDSVLQESQECLFTISKKLRDFQNPNYNAEAEMLERDRQLWMDRVKKVRALNQQGGKNAVQDSAAKKELDDVTRLLLDRINSLRPVANEMKNKNNNFPTGVSDDDPMYNNYRSVVDSLKKMGLNPSSSLSKTDPNQPRQVSKAVSDVIDYSRSKLGPNDPSISNASKALDAWKDAAEKYQKSPAFGPASETAKKNLADASNNLSQSLQRLEPSLRRGQFSDDFVDANDGEVFDILGGITKSPSATSSSDQNQLDRLSNMIDDIIAPMDSLDPSDRILLTIEDQKENLFNAVSNLKKTAPNTPARAQAEKEVKSSSENLSSTIKKLQRIDQSTKGNPSARSAAIQAMYQEQMQKQLKEQNEFKEVLKGLRDTGLRSQLSNPGGKPSASSKSVAEILTDEQKAKERLKDAIKNLNHAVDHKDANSTNSLIRQVLQNAKDYSEALENSAANASPSVAESARKRQAVEQLRSGLPNLVNATKAAMSSKFGDDSVQNFAKSSRDVARIADKIGKPREEKQMIDNWNAIKEKIKQAQAQKQLTPDYMKNEVSRPIEAAIFNIQKAAARRAGQNVHNPAVKAAIDKSAQELADIWEKFGIKAKTGEELALQVLPKMEQAWKSLDAATNASNMSPVEDVQEALEDLYDVVAARDAERVMPTARDLLAKVDNMANHFMISPDSSAQADADRLIDELKPTVKQILEKSREVVKADNAEQLEEVRDLVDDVQLPIARLKKALDKKSLDRETEVTGAEVKSASVQVKRFARGAPLSGSKSGPGSKSGSSSSAPEKDPMKSIKEAIARHKAAVAQANATAAAANGDAKKSTVVKDGLLEFQKLRKALRPINGTAPPSSKAERSALLGAAQEATKLADEIQETLTSTVEDDAIKGAAILDNAMLLLPEDEDMDLGDLIGQADVLNGLFRGMADKFQGQTNTSSSSTPSSTNSAVMTNLSKQYAPKAKAISKMSELIQNIETREQKAFDQQPKSGARPTVSSGSSTKAPASGSSYSRVPTTTTTTTSSPARTPAQASGSSGSSSEPTTIVPVVPLSQAKSFEDVATAVAASVQQASNQQSANSTIATAAKKSGQNIAQNLASLADFARTGDRQQMLVSAKSGSANILSFSKQLSEAASSITGKTARDEKRKNELIRTSQALHNFATQLKILTSVKAASISDSRDADESLSALSRNLGTFINQGLNLL
eukprot:TRINITY_DN496_c1_g1_i3.p1 TRINITY_DN496_c1_g1~~TRINITY_DN496_c1_g1_i3.p1  ORF type:complete len:1582 (-),score=501.89 TRINITY_DN496_c1_g1_i3:86-4831(-)